MEMNSWATLGKDAEKGNNRWVFSQHQDLESGWICKRALLKRLYFEKETYIFKEPTANWIHTKDTRLLFEIQGREDPQDVLSCSSFYAKEPLILGLLWGKRSKKIMHPMDLRHPIDYFLRKYKQFSSQDSKRTRQSEKPRAQVISVWKKATNWLVPWTTKNTTWPS